MRCCDGWGCVVGRILAIRYPCPDSQSLWMLPDTAKGNLQEWFEMGRLFSIIQVGPRQASGSYKRRGRQVFLEGFPFTGWRLTCVTLPCLHSLVCSMPTQTENGIPPSVSTKRIIRNLIWPSLQHSEGITSAFSLTADGHQRGEVTCPGLHGWWAEYQDETPAHFTDLAPLSQGSSSRLWV